MSEVTKILFGLVDEMRAMTEEARAAGEEVPDTEAELRVWLIQRWTDQHAEIVGQENE